MGISPLDSYRNFSQNSISDRGSELRRQLETRKSQLEKLSSQEVLSDDQLKRKKDLEQTVSMLENKLSKHRSASSDSTKSVISESSSVENATTDAYSQSYAEGKVISKSAYKGTGYAQPDPSKTYLKGFFFDARI